MAEKGTSQDTEETDQAMGTHSLETAEEGTSQDTKRKLTKQGALTFWRQQREGQVRTPKETKQARGTHILEMAEGGTSQDTKRKWVRDHKIRDKEGKIDPKLVVAFFQ